MSSPARYFDLVREMKNAYNHRLRLVAHARQHGIKATARLFQTTVPTVRKWLRRYHQQGPSGFLERSRAPHHCPPRRLSIWSAKSFNCAASCPPLAPRA